MRFLVVSVCLLIPAQAAIALSPGDCTRITSPADRLACFDRLFPADKKDGDAKSDLRDITVGENARLDKSLRSICRDCLK
jgi:hypothetical protein